MKTNKAVKTFEYQHTDEDLAPSNFDYVFDLTQSQMLKLNEVTLFNKGKPRHPKSKEVRMGIQAPKSITIMRLEVLIRQQQFDYEFTLNHHENLHIGHNITLKCHANPYNLKTTFQMQAPEFIKMKAANHCFFTQNREKKCHG